MGLVILAVVGIVWFTTQPDNTNNVPPVQQSNPAPTYVTSQACIACHTEAFDAWRGSHHDLAMQPATATTVLADFNNVTFEDDNVEAHFYTEGDTYWVRTQGPDGEQAAFQVVYTFGVEPLQQYLIELPGNRLQAFTILWDVENQRWFNQHPEQAITPDDPLHWSQRAFTWNSSCADCHSTDLRLNYNLETDTYHTTWAEIDVACEACHGPGSDHVALMSAADADTEWTPQTNGLIVHAPDSERELQMCARCHSRRYPITEGYEAGDPFLDHYVPATLDEGLYHPDGQILNEVFVYGSFVQSKMYQSGVACSDCHDPHSLELERPGNATCTTCHQSDPAAAARFESLEGATYDSVAHHFHPDDSSGAECVGCHMPAETYMVIDPRRDHRFGIPRPDLSLAYGVPNACIACHTEQSHQWAVDTMVEWYGTNWQAQPDWTSAFAAGRAGAPGAQASLRDIAADTQQPAIARATALNLLQAYLDVDTLTVATTDADPLVRMVAARGLENAPDIVRRHYLMPLLTDEVRAVRIAAARSLASLSPPDPAFDTALDAYEAAQLALPDHPEGHTNLGQLYTLNGDTDRAIDAYNTAITRDPNFTSAYNNLATLYYQIADPEQAEATLRAGIAAVDEAGLLHYSLGLLLAEQGRTDEALNRLHRATELLPDNLRVHYNYGLFALQVGRVAESEAALLHAHALNPRNADTLYALTTLYIQTEAWDVARRYAEELVQIDPASDLYRQLMSVIDQRSSE